MNSVFYAVLIIKNNYETGYTAYENIVLPLHLDGRKENREQQRVAIARAFAVHPIVILADEPTGNLDVENANEVVLLLSKAARVYNQTIVMVTHDRQMADYADRIITIQDGIVKA